MPASTLTKHRATRRSTVALKALMAVTGAIMVGYLIAHMLGNLWVFAGAAQFNSYAHHIREIGEPMLPHEGLLWIIRVVLTASVIAHVYAAIALWRRGAKAAGGAARRYHTTQNRRGVQRSYASFTMRYGGIVILLFVVYHLLHLTSNDIHPGGASNSPYDRVVNGFEVWWVTLSYVVAMVAVGLHLRHGLWAAAATLGANTSSRRRRNLNLFAIAVSLFITVGFLVPPISIFLGWVG
ncbi:MAG: succinate dehydrogenase subunit [Thermoleophilia bacterium]|nr:succinate dehydrogenase subunit [Thermoleophilia bacterium]